ncbi:MAG: hypothetical protein HOK20_05350 [Alphaproteobacteria bacterium]|nr:hypothetical protein [Alphaproteobacteria bacterium]MBT5541001.1 hypothetical protein [Alphaproteobacteria bacterium]
MPIIPNGREDGFGLMARITIFGLPAGKTVSGRIPWVARIPESPSSRMQGRTS